MFNSGMGEWVFYFLEEFREFLRWLVLRDVGEIIFVIGEVKLDGF